MRSLIAATSLAMALTPALAQPVLDKIPDRHSAMVDEPLPKTVRTITISPTHTFEERWEPVHELLRRQAVGQRVDRQNAPAASAAPLPTPRPVAKVADRARDLCERHGLRKVITNGGRSWRCR